MLWVESFTTPLSGSSENNLLNQGIPALNVLPNELCIQTGTASTCYTSQNTLNPFIMLAWIAAVNIPAVVVIGQIDTTDTLYNSN
jgi:hypothetical protein